MNKKQCYIAFYVISHNRSLILGSPSMTMDVTTTTSISAVQASYNVGAAAIIAITTSGKTATEASRFRPMCPIVAVTRFHQVARQMQLHRGIMPLFYEGMFVALNKNVAYMVRVTFLTFHMLSN